ncbi:MAG: TonB-dependent receptor [Bacteroidota bacterium]|nr:TonB-dependent receptor [Bacteroidota bacterium]
MKKLFFIIFSIFFTQYIYAQTGTLRGAIYDEQGEPMFATNVYVTGTSIGTVTDFDGKFELQIEEGAHSITFSYIGYENLEISEILIKKNEVTVLDNISLSPNSISMETVTISAEAKRTTEAALITVKKNSVILLDAVSSETLKQSGDGNAASAAKRVSGVSVEGGKYVFVRGLGDRYTKTQVNGMDIPGLDPDRNSIQMDIFPTNIIDNISVFKSFSASFPADFTGGIVNIETKSFPDTYSFNTSLKLSYNSMSSFKNDFISYKGSSTDILGFDDGQRDLPIQRGEIITFGDWLSGDANIYNENYNKLNSLEKTLATSKLTSLLNSSFSISSGNQKELTNFKLGYITAFSHKNNYTFYRENVTDYSKDVANPSNYALEIDENRVGEVGKQSSYISLLGGIGLKNELNKYKLNIIHLQNGEKSAALFDISLFQTDQGTIKKTDVLDYTERSITNILLSGNHYFNQAKSNLSWKISPTYSRIRDKDIRETSYIWSETTQKWYISPNTPPTRKWRYLDEYNLPLNVNYQRKMNLFERKAKFDIGINYTYKFRKFDNTNISLKSTTAFSQADFTGNPNELLTDLLVPQNGLGPGFVFESSSSAKNRYESSQSNIAFYAQQEFFPIKKLKSIIGVRGEYYQQFFNGQNQNGIVYNNLKVIEDVELYPAINLIYEYNKNSNLRFSAFRTTARPSFKEKADIAIIDAVSGYIFNGNIDLNVSKINNIDLRYETYLQQNQTISISAFYKTIKNAIELSSYTAAPNQVRPINANYSDIKGIEFESKFKIPYFSNLVNELSINFNTSLISSRTYISGQELEGKNANLREGELLTNNNDIQEKFLSLLGIDRDNDKIYRVMQGQAPYLVNLGIRYKNTDLDLQSALYYNVQGPTLQSFSLGESTDIYSKPFNSLNFSLSKKLGIKYTIDFSIKNILNNNKELTTSSYGTENLIYRSYNPGRFFSFKLSYKIN